MRRFRIRYCLLVGIALLLLVLLRSRTSVHERQPEPSPKAAEEKAVSSPRLGLNAHRGGWKVVPRDGARVVMPEGPATARVKSVNRVRPGEQSLLDNVNPDAFLPPEKPSTAPSTPNPREVSRNKNRDYEIWKQGQVWDKIHKASVEIKRQQNSKIDLRKVDNNAIGGIHGQNNNENTKYDTRNGYLKTEISNKKEGRGGVKREGAVEERGRDIDVEGKEMEIEWDRYGKRKKEREREERADEKQARELQNGGVLDQRVENREEIVVKSRREQTKLREPGEIKEEETVELSLDEIRAARGMHTEPPWTQTAKPLRYEDYSANCSPGSLPIPGTTFHTKKFCLVEDTRQHFGLIFKQMCYHKGTDIEKTRRSPEYCECKSGWHGKYCSMPEVVHSGGYPNEYGVGMQTLPRRLLYAFPFNGEFDMLEITITTLSDSVDVFLILESNYTAAGQPKERVLLQQFQKGYLKEFQHKVVYISLDYFPRVAYTNGWEADALLRNHISKVAFDSILENVRDDDIIVSLDADEIVQPETLMFLRLHYGYPEPFGFTLQHTVYGYFWLAVDEFTDAYGGCRVSLLRDLLNGHLYDVRNAPKNVPRDRRRLDMFKRKTGARFKPWRFGSKQLPAGWHCSWCFPPEGIQYKLISAHASDFPRWGTFPDKTELGFITKLVQQGMWFDEKTLLQRQEPYSAPPYVRNHAQRFTTLVNHTAYMAYSQKYLNIKKNINTNMYNNQQQYHQQQQQQHNVKQN